MFWDAQSHEQKDLYREYLTIIGNLSNLFSSSATPYLYYRAAENVFCKAFGAIDLSRSDVSSDAMKSGIGIGLKTFLKGNEKTLQKIAEFNSQRELYKDLKNKALIYEIAKLRNKRINFTENAHGLERSIYHCVVRDNHQFNIFEEPMDKINLDSIQITKSKGNSILFHDELNEYSFNLSKSTLFKRFNTQNYLDKFDVKILNDPLVELKKWIHHESFDSVENVSCQNDHVFLPLYGAKRLVYPKSGLNQWNADGRIRDKDEVYIPVPKIIHKNKPGFFPSRDKQFNLKLPNQKILISKLCQSNSKALMSQSNKALGQWILREVLKLPDYTLITRALLDEIGIDSVRIDKIDDYEFEINFAKLGSYEEFLETFEN